MDSFTLMNYCHHFKQEENWVWTAHTKPPCLWLPFI